MNIARWYAPMPFFFTTAYYWTAWVSIGAVLVHVALKAPVVAEALVRGRRAYDAATAIA